MPEAAFYQHLEFHRAAEDGRKLEMLWKCEKCTQSDKAFVTDEDDEGQQRQENGQVISRAGLLTKGEERHHWNKSCPTRAGLLSRIRADVISATLDTDLSQRWVS
ncbi:hypothetical protein NQZ68_025542 [Dissostichus eleginoides]|nr:hypothetical protein NQZ68_025542 [Dissostichus eleginoides]